MKNCQNCGTPFGGACHFKEKYTVPLPDGGTGIATVTAHQPDTFFSIPARLVWRGVRLDGWVGEVEEAEKGEFHVNIYGKNLKPDIRPTLRAWLDYDPVECSDCKKLVNRLDARTFAGVLYQCFICLSDNVRTVVRKPRKLAKEVS